jgi:hypothetical protein
MREWERERERVVWKLVVASEAARKLQIRSQNLETTEVDVRRGVWQ